MVVDTILSPILRHVGSAREDNKNTNQKHAQFERATEKQTDEQNNRKFRQETAQPARPPPSQLFSTERCGFSVLPVAYCAARRI